MMNAVLWFLLFLYWLITSIAMITHFQRGTLDFKMFMIIVLAPITIPLFLLLRLMRTNSKVASEYARLKELEEPFRASGVWGNGWLPSPLYDYRQALGLMDYYGMSFKVSGGVGRNGQWINWYVTYPEDRWNGKPRCHPAGFGGGPTLGEAVVRCILSSLAAGVLGQERFGPKK